MLLDAQGSAGPVGGGAPDGLADPGRQAGEVARDALPSRALVQPRDLQEAAPLVVLEGVDALVLAGLEHHHLDALLGQLVAERAAAGAGADDHHHESSLSSNVAMIIVLPQPRNGGGLASASGCMVQPTSWKPRIR